MFGFIGEHIAKLEYTQHSARTSSSSGQKSMDFFLGTGVSGLLHYADYIFDVDNTAVSIPVSQNFGGVTSFDATKTRASLSSVGNISIQTQDSTFTDINPTIYRGGVNSRGLGWTFNVLDTTALNPPSIKNRALIARPRSIRYLGFGNTANLSSGTHNKGHTHTNNLLDLSQFQNLRVFYVFDMYNTSILIKFSDTITLMDLNPRGVSKILDGSILPKKLLYLSAFWGSFSPIGIPSNFFQNCTGLTSLCFTRGVNENTYPGLSTAFSSRLTGTTNISNLVNLKEFYFARNTELTSMTLPTGKTDWVMFHVEQTTNAIAQTIVTTTILNDLFNSPNLNCFFFVTNAYSITRDINDLNYVRYFWIHNNSWTGDINLTGSTLIKDFRTGNNALRTGSQLNNHPNVNISGLTGATYIDLSACLVENLELPVNTVCTTLNLVDNLLDITTNPNLLSQINAMTGIVTLNIQTQSSVNGFGSNPYFTGLTNMTTLTASSCKFSGTLTLPATNKLLSLNLDSNASLTSIVNLGSHTVMTTLLTRFCTSLSYSIPNTMTKLATIRIDGISGMTNVDLSGSVAVNTANMTIINTPISGAVTFPATTGNFSLTLNNSIINLYNCGLTSIVNLENVTFSVVSTHAKQIFMYSNNLDQILPFGENTLTPNRIQIQDNGMSISSVDGTLTSLFTNRTKFNGYTASKYIIMDGTNAAPTGTYQAPTGYRTHAALTVTSVTKANPGVVTVSAIGTVTNGDIVYFYSVVGMTELTGNYYKVNNVAGNTFELQTVGGVNVDTSAYGTFTSGFCRPDGDPASVKEMTYVLVNQYIWTVTQN